MNHVDLMSTASPSWLLVLYSLIYNLLVKAEVRKFVSQNTHRAFMIELLTPFVFQKLTVSEINRDFIDVTDELVH